MKHVLALVVLTVFSCPVSAANVRVSHLAPRAPTVDVMIDGRVAFEDVPFRSVTNYFPVADGVHRVQVFKAGERTNPVLEANDLVFLGGNYTITAAGIEPEKANNPVTFVDDLNPIRNRAKLRVINAAPDVARLELTTASGVSLAQNIPFKGASAYLELGAGVFDFELRGGSKPVFLNELSLQSNRIYTVFLVGFAADQTLNYVFVEDRIDTGASRTTTALGAFGFEKTNCAGLGFLPF